MILMFHQLNPNPELSQILSALEGKNLFSPMAQKHAENVSRQLGIDHLFDDIFDIRAANYIPKPQTGL